MLASRVSHIIFFFVSANERLKRNWLNYKLENDGNDQTPTKDVDPFDGGRVVSVVVCEPMQEIKDDNNDATDDHRSYRVKRKK